MHTHISDWRRAAARWRNEHDLVADEATACNLRRMRQWCPVVAGVALVNLVVVLVQAMLHPLNDTASSWHAALILTHLGCGVLMTAFAVAAYHLRHAHRSRLARMLTHLVVITGLLYAAVVVSIDQLLTPNITLFLVACVFSSLVVFLRPIAAAGMYATAALVFLFTVGWVQPDATQLLLNQLNGLGMCFIGWALALLHWRQFTVRSLQKEQIDKLQLMLQQRQKELERLTRLDGLTGLYNRNTFVELTRKELLRAKRQGSNTSIMLLDLDHFKRVNDTWGHPAGDAVLRHVAALINSAIRNTDLAGRLGGEEFIILLPGTTNEGARKIAEKIRARLEATPARWDQQPIAMTVSIGLSSNGAGENRDFDHLYTEGDKALYLAKHRGRNCVI